MIRCAWCGAENYAIDSWCASCSRHLDWAPPAARRERRVPRAPAVAAVGVAIILVLPLAARFAAAGRPLVGALPNTAMQPAAPAALASASAPTEPAPTLDGTPTPSQDATQPVVPAEPAQTPPVQTPTPEAAPGPVAGDPAAAIARFYQAVSGHDFAAAAAVWSSRMLGRYPPSVYIDHRFAATQQINLQAARTVGNRDRQAIVYVRVVEVLDGQTRHWVGTWQLVNTGSGWLLDQPNLQSGT